MVSKTATKAPKIQRGLSLAKPLYDKICQEADRYGRTWNETVELVLQRAFAAAELHDSQLNSPSTHEADIYVPEEGE